MGRDMGYVKGVQEAVDILVRRRTREQGDSGGFIAQWYLHLEVCACVCGIIPSCCTL